MLFGESQFKSPKKTNLLSLRGQLLPMVLLLAIAGLILTIGKLPWTGTEERSGPGGVTGTALSSESGSEAESPEGRLAPLEPQAPQPFEERPEVLARAAVLDRSPAVSDEAIAYLFQRIRTHEAEFRAAEPVLSLEHDDAVWRKLIDDPHMYRGRLIEVKGRVRSAETGRSPLRLRGLDFPNPSGLDRRFETFLFGTDSKYYKVTTFRNAPDLRHQDAARLRAYFCGLYTNQVEHQGRLQLATVPFLVGEAFEPITVPKGADASVYLPLVLGLLLAAVAVVVVLHVRTERTYERRRLAVRGVRQAGRPAAPAGDSSRAGDVRSGGDDGSSAKE